MNDADRKTVTVRTWGERSTAYAEQDGDKIVIRVYDDLAGHYTVCHSLSTAQQRYVVSRTLQVAPTS